MYSGSAYSGASSGISPSSSLTIVEAYVSTDALGLDSGSFSGKKRSGDLSILPSHVSYDLMLGRFTGLPEYSVGCV